MKLNRPVSVQDDFGPIVRGCGSDFDFTLLFEESILFIGPILLASVLAILELARRYNHQTLFRGGILLSLKLFVWIGLIASQIAFLAIISTHGPRTRASTAVGSIGIACTLILTCCSYFQHGHGARSSSVLVLYLLWTLPMDALRARTLWDTVDGRGAAISIITYASFKLCAFVLEILWKCAFALQSGLCDATEEKHGIIGRALMLRVIPFFAQGYRIPLQAQDLYKIAPRLMNVLLDPILPRLSHLALQFTQSFLVERAIDLISDTRGGLIAAYAFVYIGIAIMASTYEQKAARAATLVRADLSSRIFQQSLKLDRTVISKDSNTTMITADVERVQAGVRKMHDLWGNLVTVGLGLWLVECRLGPSSLLTLALIFGEDRIHYSAICLILTAWWSARASKYQETWFKAMEMRLHKTIQVLKGIKVIKQMGGSQAIFDLLEAERALEIGLSKHFRLEMIAIITLSQGSQLLNARNAFAALTLFQLVSSGIQDGAAHGMQLMVAIGSLKRVQASLNQRKWKDGRRHAGDESTDTIVVGSGSNDSSTADYAPEKEPREKPIRTEFAMTLDKVTTKWSEEGDLIVKEISFNIPRDGLTVIYGPTGSGKSTLLKLMTGDNLPVSGKVSTADRHIAFCDQPPWIANLSVRDNIVGARPFDEKLYNTVIDTCALDWDVRELAEGDQHMCELNGGSISGGQRVRIALARILYSKANIVILNNCFVGLDRRTEKHVLNKLFAPDGILRSRATILAASSPTYLSLANHVITIDASCNIVREGQYIDVGEYTDNAALASHQEDDSELLRVAKDVSDTNNSSDLARNFVLFLLLCSLFVVGSTYPQVFLRSWTEKTLQGQKSTVSSFYGVLFGVGSMAWLGFYGACFWLFLQMAVRVARSFHTMLLETMLNASIDFFAANDSGRTLNRFSQDLQMIDMELPLSFIGTAISLLTVIAQCVVIIVESPWTGFAVLGLAIVLLFVFRFYLRSARRLRYLDIEMKAPVLSLLIESIDGLATVRAFGWIEWYVRRGLKVLGQAQVPFHHLQTAQLTLNLWLDLLVSILAIVVTSIAVGTHSSSGGSLGLALLNIVGLGQSVRIVVHFYTTLEITLGAVARIRDFVLQTESENAGREEPPPEWPRNGSIAIQNVTISHSSSLPPIIEGFELNIAPGSKVAICGRTGSGKTTLVNSLLQLVHVSAGTILIDGVDIATIRPKDIRTRLVALPQETLELSVSIQQYAKVHGISNDEDIIRGLTEGGLWSVIERIGGLDMLLTDDSLSHGQWQLLGMTLACLQRGKIVLMDEPTSHVDVNIQSQFHRAIFDTFSESTVVCITHQVDTILDFDVAIVLDRGKIVEHGSPRALLNEECSRLKQLYSLQKAEAVMVEKLSDGNAQDE
ncbi:P-loop containing nucleoside triphosphate hydrolase protein [Trichoderma evansii]